MDPVGTTGINRNGGVEEDRTPDLRIANAALSQLSYHPIEGAILALFGSGDNVLHKWNGMDS